MKILKFGGTSVSTASRRVEVARIVERAARKGAVTVVTSALAGVTDDLTTALLEAIEGAREGAEQPAESPAEFCGRLAVRHLENWGAEVPEPTRAAVLSRLQELAQRLAGVTQLGECPAASRHRILATGERLALPLVEEALRRQGQRVVAVDGAEIVVTIPDALSEDGEPVVDLVATSLRARAWAASAKASEAILLVTGFVAGNTEGQTVTLGRGASDLTATLLAQALDAEVVEIWTDVDGVLSAPPDLVPDAFPLRRLSYGEAAGLAHFGAKVLHPKTLAPVAAAGIPVVIRNTLRPQAPGTRIDGGGDGAIQEEVCAVTAAVGASQLVVRATWRRTHLGSRVFAVMEELGVRPWIVSRGASGQTLSLVVRSDDVEVLDRELRRELVATQAGIDVVRRDNVTVVAVVGRGGVRTASAVLRSLEDGGIETLGFTMPSSGDSSADAEPTVAVLVDGADGARAVAVVHDALVVGEERLEKIAA
jgi:aspartate kinase